MTLEALELYVEGGRVSHSWCMCVAGHDYGGFGVGSDEGGGWHACRIKPGVCRMPGDAGVLPECEVTTLMTTNHTIIQMHSSGKGRAEIGRSSRKGLDMGCHEKAPIMCPCSHLAALNGAPRMRCRLSQCQDTAISVRMNWLMSR